LRQVLWDLSALSNDVVENAVDVPRKSYEEVQAIADRFVAQFMTPGSGVLMVGVGKANGCWDTPGDLCLGVGVLNEQARDNLEKLLPDRRFEDVLVIIEITGEIVAY